MIKKLFSEDELRYMRRSYRYVTPFKVRLGIGVACGAVGGAFDALMLFVLKAVIDFALVGKVDSGATGKVGFLDSLFPQSNEDVGIGVIILICAVIPLMLAIRGVFAYVNRYLMVWVGNKALINIRSEVYEKMLQQSQTFFADRKAGHLIQTVYNQTLMLSTAGVTLIIDTIKHPVSILAITFALLKMDPIFTVCALFVFPLCMLPVIYFGNRVRHSGRSEEVEAGELLVRLQEAIGGIKLVKSYAREDYELERFNSSNEKLMSVNLRWTRALELIGPLVETVASVGIAAGLVYAWMVDMTANDFWFRYIALVAMYPHVKALSRIQIQMKRFMIAAEGVFGIVDCESPVKDPEKPVMLDHPKGEIQFDNVTFSYPGTAVSAVDRVDFTFEPGKRYALVGESGAGKSTLFSLILRFFDPQTGTLKLDGIDLRKFGQRDLRNHISYVSQDNVLFHDTIENNIRYGKLDASKEELEEAARKAFAHDFILEQPQGYGTIVGDKGTKLSGGQQQRISISRAFLKDASILLLDEATSALDSESEQKVKVALDELSQGKTVIAIAHRLFTVLSSDYILYLENGKLVQYGPHAELLEISPGYKKIFEMQFHRGVDELQ